MIKRKIGLIKNFLIITVSKPQVAEAYSEPSQMSRTEVFARIVNEFQPLIIFTESSILDF